MRGTEDPRAANAVCWLGSVHGYAAVVMPACERAVELGPGDGVYRDSRGLARALTGDPRGALEDFRAFVEWSRTTAALEEFRPKRERFIAELEAGRNPFDAATLEDLRNE